MPLLPSTYRKPWYLWNCHAETIVPSLFRKVEGVAYERQRLELPDGDFLDLDWLRGGFGRCLIISHGLEGSSERHYVKGMARYFYDRGWDVLAWNCRSCSGELNRLPRFYHHGATEDMAAVVEEAMRAAYPIIALAGISMGGSLTLKYLGERGAQVPRVIRAAAAFSVPCDLGASAARLEQRGMEFYKNRFLKKLGRKIQAKAARFPDVISAEGFSRIRTFRDFDNRYTAPLHGFADADDFYARAACLPFLPAITVPTLLVNAHNDPFLTPSCFPQTIAKSHDHLFLEVPPTGGHTGFSLAGAPHNAMEMRAWEFISPFAA